LQNYEYMTKPRQTSNEEAWEQQQQPTTGFPR
jgi:hypothetical protein